MNDLNDLAWIKNLSHFIGLKEIPGSKHNVVIQNWLKNMGCYSREQRSWWRDDETPWCGLAVGHALGVSGRFVVPYWFRAKAWADEQYMTKLDKPAFGCIAVKSRQGGGHVFFVVGMDQKGRILGLGGNQGNQVSIVPFNKSEIDSYWWPSKWDGERCIKSIPSLKRYQLSNLQVATLSQGVSEA